MPHHPSDDFVIKTWSVDDGLPESSPTCVTQTPDGYLWVSTWNGLARFDGSRFTAYHSGNTPALTVSRISSLAVGRDSTLWICTAGGGLVAYRHGRFRRYGTADGLTDLSVNGVCEDAVGQLWLATDGGIFERKGETFIAWKGNALLPASIGRIGADPAGSLWVTADDAIFRLTTSSGSVGVTRVSSSAGNGITIDSRGRVWYLDENSILHRSDGHREMTFPQFRAFRYSSMWPLKDGRIGLCFLGRIVIVEEDQITEVASAAGVPLTTNENLFEDREGNLWLGRASSGLSRLRKRSVTVLGRAAGLTTEVLGCVVDDRGGHLWVGTYRHGLNALRGGRFHQVELPNVPTYATVSLLRRTADNVLWVGPQAGGLLRIVHGRQQRYARGIVRRETSVTAMDQDASGGLLIGTRLFGVQWDDARRLVTWNEASGLSSNSVNVVLCAANGDLWVGTASSGVNLIRHDTITVLTTSGGLSNNEVQTLVEDDDGSIWIGTRRGLNRWNGGTIVRLTENDGIPDEAIASMIDDGRGSYWIGGIKGIFRVRKDDLRRRVEGESSTLRSSVYGTEDGMVAPEVGGGGNPLAWKDGQGILWFVSERGLIRIDPATVAENPVRPPVVIEEALVDHRPVPVDSTVLLRPADSKVEFVFTGISFRSPGKVRFRYRLEGLEPEWQEGGTRRYVQYTSLPSGEYRFHVAAANSDGVWNETGASLAVVVLPPFWRTTWFSVLAVIAFLTTGPTIYVVRVRALKRANRKQQEFGRQLIERQEEERQRIARDMHDSLGQELLVLKHKVQTRLRKGKRTAEPSAFLADLSDSVSAAIQQVRQISHNLRPPELDRLGLSETLRAILERIRALKVFELHGAVDDIDGLLPKDGEISVVRIVQETLNNVLKHAQATAVTVLVERSDDSIRIEVRDNGVGIGGAGERGKGLGLADLHERASVLNGRSEYHQGEGGGTVITVILPVGARDGR